jgi:glycerol-3-phosphate dehydrogenase
MLGAVGMSGNCELAGRKVNLDRRWDVIIIGGGITGAAIFRLAAHAGLHTLLLEQADFAAGTSSRSSKLVHGGLRYLRNAQIRLTFESVRQRQRLLEAGRGLVRPLPFLLPNFGGDRPPAWVFGAGLVLYDLFALSWQHRHYQPEALIQLCPPLKGTGLLGGYRFFDAQADDARMVLRLVHEGVMAGGRAVNYTRVTGLLRRRSGAVAGVRALDLEAHPGSAEWELEAPLVINATGAWADELRAGLSKPHRLRQLRGSHLVFPANRLPLGRAVTALHPADRRPVFFIPWEGVTLLGTTDLDSGLPVPQDPAITADEAMYLLRVAQHLFPALGLTMDDVQATYSGMRAVVNTGQANPSRESREHAIWLEDGLLTVTGGKLTTFDLMARSAMRHVLRLFSESARTQDLPPFDPPVPPSGVAGLPPALLARLAGRHGTQASALLRAAGEGELNFVGDTPTLWAELRWGARSEWVVHLEDLMLRRTRLGLLLADGGRSHLDPIGAIARAELGWSMDQWRAETKRYLELWGSSYAPPGRLARQM